MLPTPSPIEAVIFDKDGTLLDFHKTWNPGIEAAIRQAAHGPAEMAEAASRLGFDLDACRTLSGSILIADSNDAILSCVADLVDLDSFAAIMFRGAAATVAPSRGVTDLLDRLDGLGIALGVATNDYEATARGQIAGLGWATRFAAVVGCDSGFGAKPSGTMIRGTCTMLGVNPGQSVMVGDNLHDLVAAHDAGVFSVLVTNGDEPPVAALAEADLVVRELTHLVSDLGLDIVDETRGSGGIG